MKDRLAASHSLQVQLFDFGFRRMPTFANSVAKIALCSSINACFERISQIRDYQSATGRLTEVELRSVLVDSCDQSAATERPHRRVNSVSLHILPDSFGQNLGTIK